MAGERTEAPTPKRLRDARKQGNVAKSQELASMGVLLAAVIAIRVVGPSMWEGLRDIMADGLTQPVDRDLTAQTAEQFGRDWSQRMLLLLAPFFAVLALAGIAFNVGQTGLLLSSSGIKPKMSHINPGSGLKRLFSKQGGMNLAKALLKLCVVAVVVWLTMRGQMAQIVSLGDLAPAAAASRLAGLSFDIALRAAAVLFGLALADYAWQRRQYIANLRMTKDELRQEMRESEGSPEIKAAIRRRRMALLNRMIAAVPKADVVVTNPTHFAVALKYDPVTMGAPVVVAKGQDFIAQRIKEVARKNGVPVLEEPPLARALFKAVPVGHPVPANLFHAVAEVLAWVYAMRQRAPWARRPLTRRAGAMR